MNFRSWSPLVLVAACLPLLAFGEPQDPQETPQSTGTRELFLANCASCHGEQGDGEGVTDLDRKARSFKAGGFSYGNTPETVQRTITSGIPGTPMPAFGEALAEKQIADLARYVIELGPGLPPPPKNTELIVGDRPVIVRGMLPPIAEGAVTHPRALAVGMPDGFTFEYRTDDVRLLGLRQGRFVDRSDWVGRGGTGLKPLGTVVALVDGGQPAATFRETVDGAGRDLKARFRGTAVSPQSVEIRYELIDDKGAVVLQTSEFVRAVQLKLGAGYLRGWSLGGVKRPLRLGLNAFLATDLRSVEQVADDVEIKTRTFPDGSLEFLLWSGVSYATGGGISTGSSVSSELNLRPDRGATLSLLVLRVPAATVSELGAEVVVQSVIEELSR